jgi:hypothetical protein
MFNRSSNRRATVILALAAALLIGGCASKSRLGMVTDPQTGLQYGSVVENNVVIDAAQFRSRKINVNTRNTSGNAALDMWTFAARLRDSYAGKGYQPTEADDFGIRVDLNVLRSSQIQSNYAAEYGFSAPRRAASPATGPMRARAPRSGRSPAPRSAPFSAASIPRTRTSSSRRRRSRSSIRAAA